jgi:hypothetical protein
MSENAVSGVDHERHLAYGRPEAVAATEDVDNQECGYENCDSPADYQVEFRQQDGDGSAVVAICDGCSQANRIHVDANDLLNREVGRDE